MRQYPVFYNEIEPFPALWLRNLGRANLINPGVVCERSIRDLRPDELDRRTQAHFFAGLGAWSYALRLAGWPDDRPVWTGSCPCQPFSLTGKGAGFDDPRHLWPTWFGLIRECRPPVLFGEQVEGPLGREWLDLVFADLEGAGYACGAAVLPAASVGAPHGRHRIFFVAERLADDDDDGLEGLRQQPGAHRDAQPRGLADGRGAVRGVSPAAPGGQGRVADDDAGGRGVEGREGDRPRGGARGGSPWDDVEWLPCSDGKLRPTQPGLFPLAHGAPARVGRLRAYGNAIVPQVAAAFVSAYLDSRHRSG